MKTTVLRAAVVLAALASIALAGAAGVHAAGPTSIGLSVYPPTIDPERSREVQVTNAGGLRTEYTFTAPDGYSVEPDTITLDPAEMTTVVLHGDGDGGHLIVTGSSVASAGGNSDTTSAAVGVKILSTDRLAWLWKLIPYALVALAVAFLLRRLRPWEWRVTRAAR
jgi:hypothetical protein